MLGPPNQCVEKVVISLLKEGEQDRFAALARRDVEVFAYLLNKVPRDSGALLQAVREQVRGVNQPVVRRRRQKLGDSLVKAKAGEELGRIRVRREFDWVPLEKSSGSPEVTVSSLMVAGNQLEDAKTVAAGTVNSMPVC